MSDWQKNINKYLILFYMNKKGFYGGKIESIDGFEIVENSAQYNGVYVPTIRPKNGSTFLPWALSKTYYEDVIKHMIVDMRDTKLKEIGI